MAIGLTEVKTAGKLVFNLERGEEKTTRSLDVPYPKSNTDDPQMQTDINEINTIFTNAATGMAYLIQPANWRDSNIQEEQWTTTSVNYEVVITTTTPVTPETPVTLSSAANQAENDQQEHHQEG